ncbi:hypothetical protein EW146_g606 [Bondarzewia mesenterica]|uniref:Phytocyanin domain-containing protein n=1 Tax=Bondarzewia mesenterica TaxID=1095465 RepID=A0A4S4M6F3_9AGAM|nr:hypothetical protein EW146_g606 [Bondarzewia mesenterica]
MFSVSALLSFGFIALSSVNAQQVWDVTVGGPNGETVYNPTTVNAKPGDQIVFHFNPKNHTVTQSTFAQPCSRMGGGFDSQFMPVAVGTTSNFPTFNITVNDTNPIWVYCRQGAGTPNSHCGMGMVFAANPGADGAANSFANFQSAAKAQGASASSSASGSTVSASTTYTAAYGTATVPPPPEIVTVTETITVEGTSWTTTYGSYPGSPDATPVSLQGTVHRVVVGGSNLTFNPPTVSAAPRDTIVFEFHQKNHTATQSTFDAPCKKMNGGFDSDFNFAVNANATTFPTFNVTVNDTAPIWVYCRQTNPVDHCGSGMVFAVNSNENSQRNFSAFQALAEQLNGTSSSSSATSSDPSSTSSTFANSAGIVGVQTLLSIGLLTYHRGDERKIELIVSRRDDKRRN